MTNKKKKNQLKLYRFFIIKIAIYLSLGLHKGRPMFCTRPIRATKAEKKSLIINVADPGYYYPRSEFFIPDLVFLPVPDLSGSKKGAGSAILLINNTEPNEPTKEEPPIKCTVPGTPRVHICLSLHSRQGPPLSSLSGYECEGRGSIANLS
jgi:hypothetical protein